MYTRIFIHRTCAVSSTSHLLVATQFASPYEACEALAWEFAAACHDRVSLAGMHRTRGVYTVWPDVMHRLNFSRPCSHDCCRNAADAFAGVWASEMAQSMLIVNLCMKEALQSAVKPARRVL